ncbi:collagenase [Streptomyces sp. NPDC004647]|uniref:collagenase n=1 Tax=Streptomyces sp. NPDC004647 TaxID=3154671 RepID=UPI0033BC0144
MPRLRRPHRRAALTAGPVIALLIGLGSLPAPAPAQAEPAARPHSSSPAGVAGRTAAGPAGQRDGGARDHAVRLAKAPAISADSVSAPLSSQGALLTKAPQGVADQVAADPAQTDTGEGPAPAQVPCTRPDVGKLNPRQLADFLTAPETTVESCLGQLVWTYDADLARVLTPEHAEAVLARIAAVAPQNDGTNSGHLYELWWFLHAAVYHDWYQEDIDLGGAAFRAAVRSAADAFTANPHAFDDTATAGGTLHEFMVVLDTAGVREHYLGLLKKLLRTVDGSTDQWKSQVHRTSALDALVLNFRGLTTDDKGFEAAVAADADYRAALRAFAGYTHLASEHIWLIRDGLGEYGRLSTLAPLEQDVVRDLQQLFPQVTERFHRLSAPWLALAGWLEQHSLCAPYRACRSDVEAEVFPRRYRYEDGGIETRTSLANPVVEQLYYASTQVKAQFFRILGTREPLAGDPNTRLNIRLYASRADYETFHPYLFGMGTDNGGVYIENGATFYTYQRRVPQDSRLTLEELFRHEYVHYLNGRFAVPGFFGEGPWYEGDRTTAFDEGMAEYLAGATRDDGVRLRKDLIGSVIRDTQSGGPRMTVRELLHAEYARDGFRFYSYAGSFFAMLGRDRPELLSEMYGRLRSDDVPGFDAFRDRLGGDGQLQQAYDRYLDEQIAVEDDLFVPDTEYTSPRQLYATQPRHVESSLREATRLTPVCKQSATTDLPRFTCTGRITARLDDGSSPGQVSKSMAATVDLFLLERAEPAMNNLADMVCEYGTATVWQDHTAATADYVCTGPLRPSSRPSGA